MSLRIPQFQNLDTHLYQTGDERPNSGLREGNIPHSEVNQIVRASPKTVLFGQQTRLRNGVRLPDESLPRFHAGHDLVKFFYSAVRQLPPYLIDALLDMNISVTLVQGPALLVFHHPREHQSLHIGRTRRTIYLPERVLEQAFELGYDYWAISEFLIQESWPLLDYLLLLDTVRHCQHHLKTHYTLGYYRIKDTVRRFNKHRLDDEKRDDDEFRIFFRYYAHQLYSMKREDLLEQLIGMGAEGIQAFMATVAEEIVSGCQYVTANRYDGVDIFTTFRRKLQNYSSSENAQVPGCMGFDFNKLYQHYLHNKRCEFFEKFKSMPAQTQEEYTLEIKEVLYRVIEVRLHPQRAPDFKRSISAGPLMVDRSAHLIDGLYLRQRSNSSLFDDGPGDGPRSLRRYSGSWYPDGSTARTVLPRQVTSRVKSMNDSRIRSFLTG